MIKKCQPKIILLFVLSAILTLILQEWVGRSTIYSEKVVDKRLLLHNIILKNQLPEGKTLKDYGATGCNIRVFTVYLCELLHQISGLSVAKMYRIIDSVCIFLFYPLLFYFLSRWFNPVYSLIGILYYACISVLTYYLFYFHPWDRMSQLFWIVLLIFLYNNRIIPFTVLLIITMTVKFDVILLPGLYLIYQISKDNWKRISIITAGLFLVTFSISLILNIFFYSESPPINLERIIWQIRVNWEDMVVLNIAYPPLLGFTLLFILTFHKFFSKDRFMWASALFGIILLIFFFSFSNFQEIRAQMPVIILMLPSALTSLRMMFEPKCSKTSGI